VGTALVQRHILINYPTWSARLATPILTATAVAAVVIALAWLLRRRAGRWATYTARFALVAGIVALLITPAIWSGLSVQAASEGMASNLPAAGPTGSRAVAGPGGGVGFNAPGGFAGAGGQGATAPQARGADGQGRNAGGGTQNRQPDFANGATTGRPDPANNNAAAAVQRAVGGGLGMEGQVNSQMLQWLIANRGNADYILAVSSAMQASSIIIETGQPVMAIGGFSGSDPILTEASLAKLIADGKIHYFMVGGGIGGGGGFGRGGNNSFSVSTWVEQNCTAVPATTWGGTGTSQLYACGTTK
jgi:hypothetical protein